MKSSHVGRVTAMALGLALAGAVGAAAGTLTVRPGVPNVGGTARYTGVHGLEVDVATPDRNPAFVQTSHPSAETAYRVRFYVNLRNLTMANGDEFDLLAGYDGSDPTPPTVAGNALFRAVVRRTAGENWLSVFVRRDDGASVEIPSTVEMPDGWRRVELNWQKSTGPGANNGRLDLWVDGFPQTGLTGVDNDTSTLNYARWGTVAGVDPGTSGTFRVDDFASQRTSYIGPTNVFTDVPSTDPLWPFITGLHAAEVTTGCTATGYCPGNNVTREQMAVFLLVSAGETAASLPACTTPSFADVPCSSPFAIWVNELAARGVTAGCGGGNYCPGTAVTREQMAVFLLRTLEGPSYTPPACTTPSFTDVPCSSPFAPWVNELAARGITSGCGGGNFCPGNTVTRGQMAVFLMTTFELPVPQVGP